MVHVSAQLEFWLKIGSGFFWTVTYLLIIRRGFVDKTYGIPVVALCANISWEFLFSFVHPHKPPQLQVNIVWFFFDLIIVAQALTRGNALFYQAVNRMAFLGSFLGTLVLSYLMVQCMSYEFNDWDGRYAAFSQNLLMSILFIGLLANRGTSKGQSLYIGIFKMIGTILPSILFHLKYPTSMFFNLLYVSITLFDSIYIVLLYRRLRSEGGNPWTRL